MSYVVFNVLSVEGDAGAELERRFAGRAGMVERSAGFEHFELLRPVEGTDRYLVYTRWRTEADFLAWRDSQAFGAGHGQSAAAGARPERPPAASGSQIWTFEVVQSSDPG